MGNNYFIGSDGELYHWQLKNHKYISREKKGDKWVYTYPKNEASSGTNSAKPAISDTKKKQMEQTKNLNDFNKAFKNAFTVGTRGNPGEGTGPRLVSKEYEEEMGYNSKKNEYPKPTMLPSSNNKTGSTSKVSAGKTALYKVGNAGGYAGEDTPAAVKESRARDAYKKVYSDLGVDVTFKKDGPFSSAEYKFNRAVSDSEWEAAREKMNKVSADLSEAEREVANAKLKADTYNKEKAAANDRAKEIRSRGNSGEVTGSDSRSDWQKRIDNAKSKVDSLLDSFKSKIDKKVDEVVDSTGRDRKGRYEYYEKALKTAEENLKQAEKNQKIYGRSVDDSDVRRAKEMYEKSKRSYEDAKEDYEKTLHGKAAAIGKRMSEAADAGKDWIDNLFEAYQTDAKDKRSEYSDAKEAAVRADAEERKAIRNAVKAQKALDDARKDVEKAIDDAEAAYRNYRNKNEPFDTYEKLSHEAAKRTKVQEKAREDLITALEKLETAGSNREVAKRKVEDAYEDWLRANNHPLRKLDEWLENLLGTR